MKTRRRNLLWIFGMVLFLFVILPVIGLALVTVDEDPPALDDLTDFRRRVADDENGALLLNLRKGDVEWPLSRSEENEEDAERDASAGDVVATKIREEHVLASSVAFDETAAQGLIDRHRDVLRRVERCLNVPGFQLPLAGPSDDPADETPEYLELGWLLATRARLELELGRTPLAVERIRELQALGRRLQEGQGGVLFHLAGVAVQGIALELVLDWPTDIPLDRSLAQSLLDLLAEEAPTAEAMQDSLRAELAMCDRRLLAFANGEPGFSLEAIEGEDSWTLRVVVRLFFLPNQTRRLASEKFRRLIESVGQLVAHREIEDLAATDAVTSLSSFQRNGVGKILLSLAFLGVNAFVERYDTHVAATRSTLTIVALRAFREEHGRLPGGLDELVPSWLDRVPTDPYSGAPLRYDPARGVVYCLGTDLEDSGGSDQEPREARHDSVEPTFTIDPLPLEELDGEGAASKPTVL